MVTGQPVVQGLAQSKITPPKPGEWFERSGLLGKLATSTASSRRIWVSAPGGTGKTTLVRSFLSADPRPLLWYYVDQGDHDPANVFFHLSQVAQTSGSGGPPLSPLTPEYLPNLPVYCRNFFRSFYAHFAAGCVLVFDDLQEGPGETLFGTILRAAMTELPESSNLFVISREEPYPYFARERLNQSLAHLGWGELRLSLAETRDFLAWLRQSEPSPSTIDRAFSLTQGWLGGLLLFSASPDEAPLYPQFPLERTDLLFDYFASDIFARLSTGIQSFLLQCAFLPMITAGMAEDLTGRAEAREILDRLVRGNHFTIRVPTSPESYRFHPLFKQFLRSRAGRNFGPAELALIKSRSAQLLISNEQPEPAAELLIDAKEWSALSNLIQDQAETLFRQGRSQTLMKWLDALPAELRTADPRLCYWRGSCLVAQDPVAARQELEQAFVMFEATGEKVGSMLAWATAVYAITVGWGECYRLDEWISRFDGLRERYPDFASPQIEALMVQGILKALTWRQPYRADLPEWSDKLHRLIVANPDPGFRFSAGSDLLFSLAMVGSFAKARALRQQLDGELDVEGVTPLQKLSWLTSRAICEWIVLDQSGCMATLELGRQIVEASGIHVLDLRLFGQGIFLGLTTGNIPLVKGLVASLPTTAPSDSLDQAYLYLLNTELSLIDGDLPKAIALAEIATEGAEAAGSPIPLSFGLVCLALALHRNGQHEQAVKVLERGFEVCRGTNHFTSVFCFLDAYLAFENGENDRAQTRLREGFGVAAQQGYLNFYPWRDDIMTRLCREAIAAGIEVDYAKHLASVRNLDLSSPDGPKLTPKEIEVLGWIRHGKSNWEIAQILAISERTVKFHVANILTKLDAKSRTQAVAIALESGLIGDS